MPQITVTGLSLGDALGMLGDGANTGLREFFSHPYRGLSSQADSSSQHSTVQQIIEASRQRRAESQKKLITGVAVVLLLVVVVLVWLLIKKSGGKKAHTAATAAPGYGGAMPPGPAAVPQAPGETYDMKDAEIDRKDKEIERKEQEVERKERELEKEREKRKSITSKFESERMGLERELEGTKLELRKMREEQEKHEKELEALRSRHDAEMRVTREQFDAKSAEVQKRFEEQLSEFESSQKNFWPEVFQEARSLDTFCECVKASFSAGSKTAAALYAELVSLGSRLGDMQALVNQISPVGKALYAWINDEGRTGDGFDALLAKWLSEKVSHADFKVVAVKQGEVYNQSIHDCASVNGNSVSKVLSFLIQGKSNRTELKAIVEVG